MAAGAGAVGVGGGTALAGASGQVYAVPAGMEIAGGLGVVAGNSFVQAGTNFSKAIDNKSGGGSGKDIKSKDVDVNNLPDGWTRTESANGRIRIKDTNGVERKRYDPPTNGANGHWHDFSPNGTPLDANGKPTYKGAPNSHIYP